MEREKQLFSRRLIQAMRKCPDAVNSRTKHGVDVSSLQRIAGVSREMARRYLEGMAIPNPDPMRAIADWLGVRVAWLRDGEGPIEANSKPFTLEDQAALFGALLGQATPRSRDRIREIQRAAEEGRLTEEDIEAIGMMADRLLQKSEEHGAQGGKDTDSNTRS